MTIRIPLARPEITEADREAVADVLRTPYLSMGRKLGEFEQSICQYTGSQSRLPSTLELRPCNSRFPRSELSAEPR